MKKAIAIIVLVLLILAGICAVTNPKKEAHIDAIQEAYMGKLDSNSFGFLDGKSLTRIVLNETLEYKSYGLCSTSSVMNRNLAFGIFGHVFVLDQPIDKK